MFTKSLSMLAWVVAAGAVLAQVAGPQPLPARKPLLGRATNVQGLVTVSDDAGVSRVLVNNAVVDHSRYVTSSSGSVTLKMDKGCDVVLKPNQALTVESVKSCDGLFASIESIGGPSGVALAGSGADLIPFAVAGAAILLMGNGPGGPLAPGGTGAGGNGGNSGAGDGGNPGTGGNGGSGGSGGNGGPGGNGGGAGLPISGQ